MKGSATSWMLVCIAALVLLAGTLAVLIRAQKHRSTSLALHEMRDAGAACAVPATVPVHPLPGAENPPVILWAVGPVRLSFDGAPAFSPPDNPKHFPVGEHTLRAESDGAAPLETRVRLDGFTPALFHVERDGEYGLTLARVNSVCVSCPEVLEPLELSPRASNRRPTALMKDAAEALRHDDWSKAADALRGVPAPERGTPRFRRLAAGVYLDAIQPERARAELAAIPAAQSHDLHGLLTQLDRLQAAEREREGQVVMARWNKVTDRFQTLVQRFEPQAPGPTASASRRLAELSAAFDAARLQKDLFQQESLEQAAEEGLRSVVAQIRAAHPDDCRFQTEVVAAVLE